MGKLINVQGIDYEVLDQTDSSFSTDGYSHVGNIESWGCDYYILAKKAGTAGNCVQYASIAAYAWECHTDGEKASGVDYTNVYYLKNKEEFYA